MGLFDKLIDSAKEAVETGSSKLGDSLGDLAIDKLTGIIKPDSVKSEFSEETIQHSGDAVPVSGQQINTFVSAPVEDPANSTKKPVTTDKEMLISKVLIGGGVGLLGLVAVLLIIRKK